MPIRREDQDVIGARLSRSGEGNGVMTVDWLIIAVKKVCALTIVQQELALRREASQVNGDRPAARPVEGESITIFFAGPVAVRTATIDLVGA